MTALYAQVESARSEVSQARSLIDDVRAKFDRLVVAFRPIVRWLDAEGHEDAPEVPTDIRRLLDETGN